MGKDVKGNKKRLLELQSMLENYRYKLTTEVRIELLEQIIDLSLIRGLICAVSGESKFSSTAMMFMEKAREELTALNAVGKDSTSGFEITFDALAKIVGDDVTKEA